MASKSCNHHGFISSCGESWRLQLLGNRDHPVGIDHHEAETATPGAAALLGGMVKDCGLQQPGNFKHIVGLGYYEAAATGARAAALRGGVVEDCPAVDHICAFRCHAEPGLDHGAHFSEPRSVEDAA